MSKQSRFTSHGEQFDGAYDLDDADSQFRSYRSTRSLGLREDHDPVPLFLSESPEVPIPRAFGRERGVIRRRPTRTSIALIAAAVACYAVLSVKNPFPVFANATATLIGMSDVRSTPAPSAPAAQPAASVQALAPAPTEPAPRAAPTRDEIALAIRAAHQSLTPAEISQPIAAAPPVSAAPPASVAPPARRLGADELATLMTRAKGLLATGDIPSARLLLERAADAQEPSAALMLAQTYDPAVLGTQDTRNINTDPALARTWYQRAAQLGSADAQRRLSQLQ
ncbi:hypothetical protein GALL_523700 [mine drainage metagenome]|uniref:Uncharacterized protein n=1 Tax=mine drainage metagenome TaxID=410659 RepID=A0A1J5P4L0_9ZZZZ